MADVRCPVQPGQPIRADEVVLHRGSSRLLFYDRRLEPISLEGLYRGSSCFLILSGPSLVDEDLLLLDRRGIVTMGVNNSWSIWRPNLWVSLDGPGKFVHQGWLDPAITKFIPLGLGRQKLRHKVDGELVDMKETPLDCPGVLMFARNARFKVQTFLHEPTVCWGGDSTWTDELGIRGKRSVMYAALRILYHLGFSRVYLLGADFGMELGGRNYAFDQDRLPSAVRHNNAQYVALNRRLEALKPHFTAHNFTVLNCTSGSGLRPFDYIPLRDAVERAAGRCGEEIDTTGYYDPPEQTAATDELDYPNLYGRLYEAGYHADQVNSSWAFCGLLPWWQENIWDRAETFLDIGASYGGLVHRLEKMGKRAWGIDVAAKAVSVARDMGRDVRHGSATEIPFQDRSFDCVTSADVFEHLRPADAKRAIDEAIRVSKRFLAMRICTKPAALKRWNEMAGFNLHQTVQPAAAWEALFLFAADLAEREPKVLYRRPEAGEFVIELGV